VKYIILILFYVTANYGFAFQAAPVTTISDRDSYNAFISYYKDLSKKEDVAGLTSEANKQLLYQAIDWAAKDGTEEELLVVKILEVDYFNKLKNDVEVIIKSNALLNHSNVRSIKDVVYMMQDLNLAYLRTEQYVDLLNGYLLYYELLEQHNVPSRASSKNRRIANAYYKLKNYPKAITFFKKAAQFYNNDNDTLMTSGAYNDVGLSFLKLKNRDSAKFYFNKAKQIITTKKTNFKKVIDANIASIWMLDGNYQKALPFFYKELKTMGNHIGEKTSSYYKIANAHYLANSADSALVYLDSTFMGLAEVKNNNLKANALFLKGKSLLKVQNFNAADTYFERARRLQDSLDIEKQNNEYTSAAVKYETARKEFALQQSDQKIASDRRIKRYQFLALILLAIGLMVSFFVVKKVKKDKTTIETQKTLAEESAKEKELLLQELHHRVKNNLQVISSILELQASKFDDKNIVEAFGVGQNRIQAMSLIHQQLYKSENVKDISFETYLSRLIEHIKIINSEITCPIVFKTSIEAHSFSINTAVPLGLIINELITNAYKHAFVGKTHGNIFIELIKIAECQFQLVVADDGIGCSEDLDTENTLGLKLTRILSEQLGGNMHYESNNGSRFIITFKDNIAV